MRRNSINYIFAAVVMLVCLTPTAKACSCMDSGPPCQAYWPASAVFTGQVIEVTTFTSEQENRPYQQKLVRFAVSQAFRGISGNTAETITGNHGGDCGFPFKVGQSYLVYAFSNPKSNKLYASICSRTRLLSEATEDLEYFQNLSRSQGGTIVGAVVSLRSVKSGGPYQPPRPLRNVRVTVEGMGGSFDALTDSKGEYRLAGLGPGAYKVRVTPPEGLWVMEGEHKVEIQDRGCAFLRFALLPRTSLSGKVLDENGQPASKIMIYLVPADQIGERYQKDYQFVETDDNGRFEFNAIPPGEYFLGIRLNRPVSTFHYPPTFYPNTQDLSKAEAIAIREGISLEGYDLQLPEKLRSRLIEGVVLWPDGRGVSDARMCVEEVEFAEGSSCTGEGLKVEEDGHFSFSGLEGLRYLLRAHVSSGSGQSHAEPVEVPAKGNIGGIKLVLTEPNGSCAKCENWRRKNN